MKKRFLCGLAALACAAFLGACGSESREPIRSASTQALTQDYSVPDATSQNEDPSLSWNESLEATDGSYDESAQLPQEDAVIDTSASTERKLVVTLNYTIETKDLDALDASILEETKKLGGYIESSSKDGPKEYTEDSWYDGKRYASYVVRIPSEKLDAFATALEGESNVTNKSTNTEDITLQYIDTDSRRQSLREEETRLTEMLKKAETVDEMIQIENALADVRSSLKDLETQIRTFDNQVDYSTVNISVTETKEYTVQKEEKTFPERIREGFADSVEELSRHVEDLAVGLVSNLPMILYWIVILFVIILLIRLFLAILVAIFASRDWKEKRKAKKRARKEKRAQKKQAKKTEKVLEKKEEEKLLHQEDSKGANS